MAYDGEDDAVIEGESLQAWQGGRGPWKGRTGQGQGVEGPRAESAYKGAPCAQPASHLSSCTPHPKPGPAPPGSVASHYFQTASHRASFEPSTQTREGDAVARDPKRTRNAAPPVIDTHRARARVRASARERGRAREPESGSGRASRRSLRAHHR